MLSVVGVGTLLIALAGSAINLALPDLGRDLAISIEHSRWVALAYLLALATLLLPVGRLSDLLGHRIIYILGFFLFGLSSLACGLANSFELLVGMRVLQGAAGAMIMAPGPALLTTAFTPDKRGGALGMLATATYVGLTIGPPLGGLLVSTWGWRWTFFIVIPISIIVVIVGALSLPKAKRKIEGSFDWFSASTILVGLPLLLIALSQAQTWGLASWKTLGLGLTGLLTTCVFIVLQTKRKSPLLDLCLFKSRVFSGSTLSAIANYSALFVAIILIPFYLEEGLGHETSTVGILLSVQPLVMALVTSPSGWLSDRIGSRGLATLGMLIMSAGLWFMSGMDSSGTTTSVALFLGIIGLGTGIFISPNSSALMGAAPGHQQGAAGSIMAEARTLGMLIGVTLATAIFHSAGGQTGRSWAQTDFEAMQLAFQAAAVVALIGAVGASLRGKKQAVC